MCVARNTSYGGYVRCTEHELWGVARSTSYADCTEHELCGLHGTRPLESGT